jgi:Raf kinase inhibitor-like YbhB/YbcL family protein
MSLTITSPAFAHHGAIPVRYTCEAEDVSPALEWTGAPPGTKSFALIVDDPDAPDPAAPKRVYVHWVVYDMEPSSTGLPEGVKADAEPNGGRQGQNDNNTIGFMGPCPPIGRHRYFFKLYALDTALGDALDDIGVVTKADVERAMRGHVLAEAELIGTYQGQDGPAKPRR